MQQWIKAIILKFTTPKFRAWVKDLLYRVNLKKNSPRQLQQEVHQLREEVERLKLTVTALEGEIRYRTTTDSDPFKFKVFRAPDKHETV